MKVTAEELARQYREMSDGELLSLDPLELQDQARQCLHAELARRSLTPAADQEASRPEDLVAIATFTAREPAVLAQSALEAAGIATFMEKSADGLQVMVGSQLESEAREVLQALSQASVNLAEEWLTEKLTGHRVMIEDMLAEDDLVAARLTIDGKHQAFCFVRMAEGKVAETWHNFDSLPR